MHVHIHNILSSGLAIYPPYAHIPVSVLLTYMYRPTNWLLFALPPPLLQWEMRIRMKIVTTTIKRTRYHNGTFLMHTHTCTIIQRCDYMRMCFCLILLVALIFMCMLTSCVRILLTVRHPIEIVVIIGIPWAGWEFGITGCLQYAIFFELYARILLLSVVS